MDNRTDKGFRRRTIALVVLAALVLALFAARLVYFQFIDPTSPASTINTASEPPVAQSVYISRFAAGGLPFLYI